MNNGGKRAEQHPKQERRGGVGQIPRGNGETSAEQRERKVAGEKVKGSSNIFARLWLEETYM